MLHLVSQIRVANVHGSLHGDLQELDNAIGLVGRKRLTSMAAVGFILIHHLFEIAIDLAENLIGSLGVLVVLGALGRRIVSNRWHRRMLEGGEVKFPPEIGTPNK